MKATAAVKLVEEVDDAELDLLEDERVWMAHQANHYLAAGDRAGWPDSGERRRAQGILEEKKPSDLRHRLEICLTDFRDRAEAERRNGGK